ncbi:MAG: hypothetical protein ACM3UP_02440 [Methanocella sp.]
MRLALQIHPHDVRDEGAEQVVRNVVERAGIRLIAPETGTLEERHPYPKGELPHNPRRRVTTTEATLEVPLPAESFGGLPVRPRLSAAAQSGEDYLTDLRRAAEPAGVAVVPWVKALNGAFAGEPEAVCVRTLDGQPVPTWLCPNRKETEEYVFRLVTGILARHPAQAVLLDRLRYPDWSGAQVAPERMLTCFCDCCQERMAQAGINVEEVRAALGQVRSGLGTGECPAALPPEPVNVIEQWLKFRRVSITKLAERLGRRLRSWCQAHGSGTRYWLNLWPPSFAGFLGQDYAALGKVCDGAKHFPYHRLGGGADLEGLVTALSGTADPGAQERVFGLIQRALGFPYAQDFAQFKAEGLPLGFVARETAAAKRAFGRTEIFTGIQVWDTPTEEIARTVRAALEGSADGLFFYCYGWATLEALDAIGDVVRSLGLESAEHEC